MRPLESRHAEAGSVRQYTCTGKHQLETQYPRACRAQCTEHRQQFKARRVHMLAYKCAAITYNLQCMDSSHRQPEVWCGCCSECGRHCRGHHLLLRRPIESQVKGWCKHTSKHANVFCLERKLVQAPCHTLTTTLATLLSVSLFLHLTSTMQQPSDSRSPVKSATTATLPC